MRRVTPAPKSAAVSRAVETEAVGRLRRIWESFPDRHAGKSEFGEASNTVFQTMGKEIDAGNVEAGQQFVEAAPREADDQLWAVAQGNLIGQFIQRGERARFVRLLAAGRNGNNSYSSIERVPTLEIEWNKIEDRLMPLFDAFDAAITDEARDQAYFAAWGALGDGPLKTTDRRGT